MADKREKEKKNKEPRQAAPTLDQQQMARQSAPRPTMEDEARKIYQAQQAANIAGPNGAVDGFRVLREVIGREEVQQG